MPTVAPHLCPNCGPTLHDVCPIAGRTRRASADRTRGTSTERGYDSAWRALRIKAMERDSFRCQLCGWQPEIAAAATRYGQPIPTQATLRVLAAMQQAGDRHLQVDHIKPIAEHPGLRLMLGNLRTLCNSCHSAVTVRGRGA